MVASGIKQKAKAVAYKEKIATNWTTLYSAGNTIQLTDLK